MAADAIALARSWCRVPPRWVWLLGIVVGVVLFAAFGLGLANVWIGINLHAVIPGRVYRSAQLSPADLEAVVKREGIRTIINLRGCSAGLPWYDNECRATCKLDIAQEDICLSAGRYPSATELRRLVEVLDHTEYPVLLHCKRGADRTGMCSAIALMLLTDEPLERGELQLGPRFGHVAVGRTANLDAFLGEYRSWLKGENLEHSRQALRRWRSFDGYHGGRCGAKLELIEVPGPTLTRKREESRSVLTVRATNTGLGPWQFHPSPVAGVHLGLHVWDENDKLLSFEKFGFLEATVPPGGSIDLRVVVPQLKAGRYQMMIDLIEEGHCCFYQAGTTPLLRELVIRE